MVVLRGAVNCIENDYRIENADNEAANQDHQKSYTNVAPASYCSANKKH
jgi:hypothetical protein